MTMSEHKATDKSIFPKRLVSVTVPWAQLKEEEFVHIPCVLCGTFQFDAIASLVINWTEFFLVQCRNCGLIWRDPLPNQGFLQDLYSDEYYSIANHSPDILYQVGIADSKEEHQAERRRIARMQVQEWADYASMTSENGEGGKRKLLEIGGGRGYLQQAAADEGWETVGLEISPYGIREAIRRGLIVLPITLDELSEKFIPYSEYFDLAALYDFLEHVTDPARTLRIVSDILKKDGVVAIRVPNTKDYPKLHLIDHIWHFNETTMRALLEREDFEIFHRHDSGIFEAPNGTRIENITIFARKTVS